MSYRITYEQGNGYQCSCCRSTWTNTIDLETEQEVIAWIIELVADKEEPRYEDIDDRKFATMAAIMYESIETAVSSLNGDKIIHLTVEFDEYQLLVIEVDENIVLVSLMDLNINLGLILVEIEESIKKINKFGR